MTLTLRIDADRWRTHQRALAGEIPGLIPVAKGNGYGFGLDLLAKQATVLGVGTLAVGIAEEVAAVRAGGWAGDVVVLNPWRPGDETATALLGDEKVISTVSRLTDLQEVSNWQPRARVVVEIETSMRRHGIPVEDLPRVELRELRPEGWTIHLPATGSLTEANRLAAAGLAVSQAPLWVSHLSVADYQAFSAAQPVEARMRIGTRLWLGDPQAFQVRANVLDVHRVSKGDRFGYHQTKAPKDGWVLIISGGTANGVALAAPTTQRSLRQRLVTVSTGLLDAMGRALSPFEVTGSKQRFGEPPHMHSSMIFVPGSDPGVKVGDEVPVTVRMTTASFDEIADDWRAPTV